MINISLARKQIIFVVVISLLFMVFVPTIAMSEEVDNIRVMLLNGKYDHELKLTLSSSSGMVISTNDATPFTYEAKADEKIGFQFERYTLTLIETQDLSQAKQMVERIKEIKGLKLLPSVEMIQKSNKDYYRVIVGSFSSISELNEFQQLIKAQLNISGKTQGIEYLTTGSFTDVNLASAKVKEIEDKGFDAYLVKVLENNKWNYQVWVGGATNNTELQQLKQALLQKIPNLSLQDVNHKQFAIYKEFANIEGYRVEKHTTLSFSQASSVHVLSENNDQSILVKERSYHGISNKYRGELRIFLFNNKLAVVNHLPLEAYLYAVVGSEVYNKWHIEALKAQAVAARTFAYTKKLYPRNSVADLYDTTDDQAYYGMAQETESIKAAVDQTIGIVILQNGKPITSFYSSNAGGISTDGTEAWGQKIPFTSVKESPFDSLVVENVYEWYHVIRSDGQIGYVRSDFIDTSFRAPHKLGFQYGVLNDEPINFRTGPSVYYFPSIGTLSKGEEVLILKTVYENNPYSWIAGPFTADYITERVNEYQLDSSRDFTKPILDLKVAERGPSGRVTLLADGNTPIPVKYPDYYRNLLGSVSVGVQSTLFEIEQSGKIEVLGANQKASTYVDKKESVHVLSANGKQTLTNMNGQHEEYFVMGQNNQLKIKTKNQSYMLYGKGFGHGIGMSQWGAKGLAENGYTYQQILKYYYNNVELKQLY